MSIADLQVLNTRFAISNHVEFKTNPGGLTIAEITNDHAVATVALQGGHVMTFRPREQDPVIWLSQSAHFELGKSIRGGVPICWPWFGPHTTDQNKPTHGFARTVLWKVLEIKTLDDGETQIALELINTPATQTQWPYPSQLQVIITVGMELRIELITRNTGEEVFSIGEALHTYFHVSDVSQIQLQGLEACHYIDKVDNFQTKQQQGPVTIHSEVDRVYLNTRADCLIEDPGLNRRIRIAKQGSQSTVIWNPWVEKATQMGDFGDQGYLKMVCVETANALDNVVTVKPGGTHRLEAVISVELL
ncbi:MAG: D-hexose-6-phosphate mutarotase [Thioploca sp.]|nr:D-hexose-6-phosphate mutarotase [Thioploca sp.]